MSKWIYKSVPAFSNYYNVEWATSLLGYMIFIGCQPGMGWQMYAWKKEGSFYYPASIYPLLSSIYISFKAIKLHSRVGKQLLFYHYQTYSIEDGDML